MFLMAVVCAPTVAIYSHVLTKKMYYLSLRGWCSYSTNLFLVARVPPTCALVYADAVLSPVDARFLAAACAEDASLLVLDLPGCVFEQDSLSILSEGLCRLPELETLHLQGSCSMSQEWCCPLLFPTLHENILS